MSSVFFSKVVAAVVDIQEAVQKDTGTSISLQG